MKPLNSLIYYILYTVITLAISIFLIRTFIKDFREVREWMREEWEQRHLKN